MDKSKIKILVVDDEQGLCAGIQEALRREGYLVDAATDAARGPAADRGAALQPGRVRHQDARPERARFAGRRSKHEAATRFSS